MVWLRGISRKEVKQDLAFVSARLFFVFYPCSAHTDEMPILACRAHPCLQGESAQQAPQAPGAVLSNSKQQDSGCSVPGNLQDELFLR